MSTDGKSKYRPPVGERWVDGMRTAPARFEVRTEWLYSGPDPRVIVPAGRTRHAFYRGGKVVRSDLTSQPHRLESLLSNLSDAIGAFGDDKDLIVEVRLKTEEDR